MGDGLVDDGMLLLIRHAESIWNAERRWQGQADPPLSPRGVEQAHDLADRLAYEGVQVLLASSLGRARETAVIVARRLDLEITVDERLKELDVGVWSGYLHAEIERCWPEELARFRAGDVDVRAGGAESRRELRTRVLAALRKIAERHPGACIAAVTHGGVVSALFPGVRLGNTEFCRADLVALEESLLRCDPPPLS